MKFTTKNVDINGTSFKGYLNASYIDLITIFGEPNEGDGYKIDAAWEIQFSDGVVARIYNYKNGYNYCGDNGQPVDNIFTWHIGGYEPKAVENVLKTYNEWCAKQ